MVEVLDGGGEEPHAALVVEHVRQPSHEPPLLLVAAVADEHEFDVLVAVQSAHLDDEPADERPQHGPLPHHAGYEIRGDVQRQRHVMDDRRLGRQRSHLVEQGVAVHREAGARIGDVGGERLVADADAQIEEIGMQQAAVHHLVGHAGHIVPDRTHGDAVLPEDLALRLTFADERCLHAVEIVTVGSLPHPLLLDVATLRIPFVDERPDHHAAEHGDGHGDRGHHRHRVGSLLQPGDGGQHHEQRRESHEERGAELHDHRRLVGLLACGRRVHRELAPTDRMHESRRRVEVAFRPGHGGRFRRGITERAMPELPQRIRLADGDAERTVHGDEPESDHDAQVENLHDVAHGETQRRMRGDHRVIDKHGAGRTEILQDERVLVEREPRGLAGDERRIIEDAGPSAPADDHGGGTDEPDLAVSAESRRGGTHVHTVRGWRSPGSGAVGGSPGQAGDRHHAGAAVRRDDHRLHAPRIRPDQRMAAGGVYAQPALLGQHLRHGARVGGGIRVDQFDHPVGVRVDGHRMGATPPHDRQNVCAGLAHARIPPAGSAGPALDRFTSPPTNLQHDDVSSQQQAKPAMLPTPWSTLRTESRWSVPMPRAGRAKGHHGSITVLSANR